MGLQYVLMPVYRDLLSVFVSNVYTNDDMSRTHRLFQLMQALRSLPAPITAARLADATGGSARTLYRDIDTLRELGAMIDGVDLSGPIDDGTGRCDAIEGQLSSVEHGAEDARRAFVLTQPHDGPVECARPPW